MLWLIALVPLVTGIGVYATGEQRRCRLAAVAGVSLAATLLLALLAAGGGWTGAWQWNTVLQLGAVLTPLSAVVAVLVPAVALPVLLYAAAHEHRPGLGRLIALLLIFVGAMELLVIAADLLTLLIGWELVGACSWALIGHHWCDAANPRGGLYAFVMTRFGDLGLFMAAMAAFAATGSFAYAELMRLEGLPLHLLVLGLLLSAAAKSGQVPFAPWLFRAMAGPTSVSALLHAATMVAAGAYLMARLQPVLDRVAWFAPAVIAIGLTTALAGGLVATLQVHAKKLLAASTSAHFGLMFVAVGAGYPTVAILHLVVHAGFKALLFLSAGIAGGRADDFTLTRMGYGRALPLVAALSAVGSLALAGVPLLGGGWTKEAIATAAGHTSPWLALTVILAGGLSAVYAARFQMLAFGFGQGDEPEARPPHRLETVALALLAAASLLFSVIWLPDAHGVVAAVLGTGLPESQRWELVASTLTVALGLYAGWLLARRQSTLGTAPPAVSEWLGLPMLIDRMATRPAMAMAATAAWLDDRFVDALPRAASALGRRLSNRLSDADTAVVDRGVRATAMLGEWGARTGSLFGEMLADGLPEATARLVGASGEDMRRFQTGLSHHYYAMVAVGAVLLAGMLIVWS